MEIDAFVVRNARVGVLQEMGSLLFLSTRPPTGMADVDYDIALCGGWGIIIVCKVPQGTTVKDFVHELCFLVSIRCKAVCPPQDSLLDGKKKAFVCRQSQNDPI